MIIIVYIIWNKKWYRFSLNQNGFTELNHYDNQNVDTAFRGKFVPISDWGKYILSANGSKSLVGNGLSECKILKTTDSRKAFTIVKQAIDWYYSFVTMTISKIWRLFWGLYWYWGLSLIFIQENGIRLKKFIVRLSRLSKTHRNWKRLLSKKLLVLQWISTGSEVAPHWNL